MQILQKIKLEKGIVYKPSRTGSAKILKNIRLQDDVKKHEITISRSHLYG